MGGQTLIPKPVSAWKESCTEVETKIEAERQGRGPSGAQPLAHRAEHSLQYHQSGSTVGQQQVLSTDGIHMTPSLRGSHSSIKRMDMSADQKGHGGHGLVRVPDPWFLNGQPDNYQQILTTCVPFLKRSMALSRLSEKPWLQKH